MQFRCMILVSVLLCLCTLQARADLKVVTTTPDLAAIAKAVGGSHVEVLSLALSTQDPHFVDPRPNLALELSKADLLLSVGLGLEAGWLPRLLVASRNTAIQNGAAGQLDVSGFVQLLGVPQGKVDRSQGDIHPNGNPHYMLDPRRVAKLVPKLAERMVRLDPAQRETYTKNADAFVQKLAQWQAHWQERLKGLKGARVITYHQSLIYLGDWLGFEIVEHIEPKPGVPPNPGHVARVVSVGKQRGVRLILQEAFFPQKTSELVAGHVGAKLVVLPGGTNFEKGQSYLGFINECVERISKGLK